LENVIESKVDEIYRAATTVTNNISSNRSTAATVTAGQGKRTEATVSFCKERIKRTWYSKSVE
jgi:hypothetical protein